MTVSELIKLLQKYPGDTRVCAAAYEQYGDPSLLLRTLAASEDTFAPEDESPFTALVIAGDDELYDDVDFSEPAEPAAPKDGG